MTDYEHRHAIRQGHEIAASDSYFEARPQIDSNDRRKVFEAGFDRGWDRLAALVEAQQPAPSAAAAEPLHITHGPLMRHAAALLRSRKPTLPDHESVAAELEMAADGYPTPAGDPSPEWLEMARIAMEPTPPVESQPEPVGADRYAATLKAQNDQFEHALAELVDLVCPGLDSGNLLVDAKTAGDAAQVLRASRAQPSPTPQADSQPAPVAAFEVADAMADSQYLAGVSAGWNAANADDPNAALQKLHESRAGYLKPLFAARAPADSVTAPAGGDAAHTLSDAQIEAMPVWRNFVGLWPESRREIVDAVVDLLATPPTQAADSVLEDAARDAAFEAVRQRLCWMPRHSFVLDDDGVVRRVPDRTGNWIGFDAAHELFDPVAVDAAIDAARKQGGAT